ncbi:putative maltose O-acetyltransferase [Podospora fimiseda]|uniref:Maltose O-acetyltransferase n=1 Tax=Podospora fimiseda TaxID=252190 RepID=A0AAN7H1P1_9PEZI|nr:putative maltose O-acetyltransferase [Podospora fimiseda]
MATFTALNGGSPRPTEGINGAAEPERPNGQSGSADPRPPTFAPEPEGSNKRKRSLSDSPRRERPPSPPERRERAERSERPEQLGSHQSRSESREGYSTPQREGYRSYGDDRRDERREGDRERDRDQERERGDRPDEDGEQWHSRESRDERNSSYEGPYSAGPVSAQSDDQAGDRLRRATSQGDSVDYGDQSPDGDDRGYSGQYTPEQRRDGVIQSDPKKRKRNFSNRTKTGCLTCRRRKKKCDETKPECNNCIRGGFVCAGYPPQRGTWQKPESKPTQVNIESKDPNYVPPGAYGMPQQQPYPTQAPPPPPPPSLSQQAKRDPLPYNRGQPTLRITPPQGRPLQTDDDRPTASTLASTLPSAIMSPDNKLSALSGYATSASNMFPTPISAATPHSTFSERPSKEYPQRVPPLHDLTRTTDPDQQQQSLPPPPPPQSAISPVPPYSLHTGRTATPPTTQGQASSSSGGGPQATAQLALSHTFPSDRPRREKEEMLNGRQYYPFDKELVLERERCNAACWRFNNSTNPNIGVSPAERARLFRDILHPREGVHLSPTVMSPVTHTGRVGENAVVEAPFNCDYGYNIQIGNNVSIGRNCLINDVCEVRIGNNVIISPNVCIYTGTCSTDPRRRAGNKGTQYGKPVIIEDDVWIAANVVILPGVRIGRGSTVGAGSVVTRDVATYSIYMGLKAGHRRGISFIN